MRIFITGIAGLVGSTAARYFKDKGHVVFGIDNDARGRYFGSAGSVNAEALRLEREGISVIDGDLGSLSGELLDGTDAVLHCAGQPSHDLSVKEPRLDFDANAVSTLAVLEAVRTHAPRAALCFLSTNKVYGDIVNRLDYRDDGQRFVPSERQDWIDGEGGVNEQCPIVPCARTPFGASKLAADFMVQEWRESYGLRTTVFRCGCLTGPAGTPVELHGFLGYLVKCAVARTPYTVYGYGGLQVRDNLAAIDVARAAEAFFLNPDAAEPVYNLGGGWSNSCSVLEAIDMLRVFPNVLLKVLHGPARFGDHKWWITDTTRFQLDYGWAPSQSLEEILGDMVDAELRRRREGERAA